MTNHGTKMKNGKIKLTRKIPYIAYPGSTICQNFGEENEKGGLIWEIENKEKVNLREFNLKNPHPFIQIDLKTDKGPYSIPNNCHLKLIGNKTEIEKFLLTFDNSKVLDISYDYSDSDVQEIIQEIKDIKGDIDSVEQQNKFIENNFKFKKKDLQEIFKLNKYYNSLIEHNNQNKISFSINEFAWKGLFNFIEEQKLSKLDNSIFGIFGANYSGKSSLIECICWTLFGQVTKEISRNDQYLNAYSDEGFGFITINLNNNKYTIKRKLIRNKKSVSSELEFYCDNEDKTQTSVTETDKEIQKTFGTFDNFKLISLLSQFDNFGIIGQKDTQRKETILEFLNLNFFSLIDPFVKQDLNEKKTLVKYNNVNFDEDISKEQIIISNFKETNIELQNKNIQIELDIKNLKEQISLQNIELKKYNDLNLNIKQLMDDLNSLSVKSDKYDFNVAILQGKLNDKVSKLSLLKDKINLFPIEEKRKLLREIEEKIENKNNISQKLIKTEQLIQIAEEEASLLKKVPCGGEFSNCQFLLKAIQKKESLGKLKSQQIELEEDLKKIGLTLNEKDIKNEIISFEGNKIEYDKLLKDNSIEKEIELTIELKKQTDEKLEIIKNDIDSYYNNQFELEQRDKIKQEIDINQITLEDKEEEKTDNTIQINKNEHWIESSNVRISNLKKQKEQYEQLLDEVYYLDQYRKIIGKNGLPIKLINNFLPKINSVVEKLLKDIIPAKIEIKNDSDKLRIVKILNDKEIFIEACSGSEKTLVSIAFRCALFIIAQLPKCKIFIMDEPTTSLDKKHLNKFLKLLNLLKKNFGTVLLITHNDQIKDSVDKIVEVENGKIM